ncbi:MAG: RidA family protein [Sandaracinaceae bacterium]|nr:RidA family protein [Sandaracinaceae bacterium]
MEREAISTSAAPAAIGPYSQAIRCGDVVYLSGQIPLDPETGKLIEGDVRAQTERVMKNLAAVLEASGTSFAKVLKTTIFLADLGDFAVVNEVYGRVFEGVAPPARSTVQVAALPRGARVEIDLIAAL